MSVFQLVLDQVGTSFTPAGISSGVQMAGPASWLTAKRVFMFAGHLIVLPLMPRSIFTFID